MHTFPKDCPLEKYYDVNNIVKQLDELDIYYDNDYWTSNRKPMFLTKDVYEIIEAEK